MSVSLVKALLGEEYGFDYILRRYVRDNNFKTIVKDYVIVNPKNYSKLSSLGKDINRIKEIFEYCSSEEVETNLQDNLKRTIIENTLKIIGRFEPNYVGDDSHSKSIINFLNYLKENYDNEFLLETCKKLPQQSFFTMCFANALKGTNQTIQSIPQENI